MGKRIWPLLTACLVLCGCSRTPLPVIVPADASVDAQTEPASDPPAEPDEPDYYPEIELPEESPPSRTLEDPNQVETAPVLHPTMLPDDCSGLELPADGAAGYATVPVRIDMDGEPVNLAAGTPFTILFEDGDGGLSIRLADGRTGTIDQYACLVNLPDVAPSIIYDATNGYASLFRSCGKKLDGITGQALYPGKAWNTRLEREEFMMPVLYPMSKTLVMAQRAALEQGNTLVLYEGFRPNETQRAVASALASATAADSEIARGVSGGPWSTGWFIATSVSNHQRGYAVDVSLARVLAAEEKYVSGHRYLDVTEWAPYRMPTAMHELSSRAASLAWPVDSLSRTAWKSIPVADSMNSPAMALRDYCTGAGLSPLASEWWHFNDLSARDGISGKAGTGKFEITQALSEKPKPNGR